MFKLQKNLRLPNSSFYINKLPEEDSKINDNLAKYIEIFNLFLDFLDNNPHFSRRIFNYNLKKLKIKKLSLIERINIYAKYNCTSNVIRINDKDTLKHLYHELFHVLSSFETKRFCFLGFALVDKYYKNSLGRGLNEGYTEFLSIRYFGYSKIDCYTIYVYIASFLEMIIGKEKMETWYSEANQTALIEEVSKYSSKEMVIKFLKNIDYIFNEEENISLLSEKRKVFIDICNFLVNTYNMKEYWRYRRGEISFSTYSNNYYNYLNSLLESINFDTLGNEESLKRQLKKRFKTFYPKNHDYN